MRKLLTFLIALASIALGVCSPVSAQLGQIPTYITPHIGGGGSPTLTIGVGKHVANGNNPGTITVTGLNGGVNFPSGSTVYLLLLTPDNVAPVSPLIGGQTPTKITGASDTGNVYTWYFATMPAAEPDTFSVTDGVDFNKFVVAAVYAQGGTATPTASTSVAGGFGNQSGTQSPAAAITVPSAGFGVSGLVAGCGFGTSEAAVWTSTTSSAGDINSWSATTGCLISIAHTTTPGSWTATATGSPTAIAFTGGIGAFAIH